MIEASGSESLKFSLTTLQLASKASFARMDEQNFFVASLVPGSPAHRAASEVLFLLQDSYFVLQRTLELFTSSL